jgi:hypothetical protein
VRQTVFGQCGIIRRIETTYGTVRAEVNRFWWLLIGQTLLWDIYGRLYLLSFQFTNTLFEAADEAAWVNYEAKRETRLITYATGYVALS